MLHQLSINNIKNSQTIISNILPAYRHTFGHMLRIDETNLHTKFSDLTEAWAWPKIA